MTFQAPVFPEILDDLSVEGGVKGGRVPRDGYLRGWGLEFRGLGARVAAEPLFQKAAAAGAASVVSPARLHNLYLILTRFMPKLASRNVVEFGSYKGGSALFMATVLKEIDPAARLYALDTFEGMPATDNTIDAHGKGQFSDTSFADLQAQSDAQGLDNLILVKGMFQDTFPALSGNQFGLAHLDADIYSALKYAQDAVWPSMTPGGYIVYDDATVSSCIGATQAVEELVTERRIHSEQIWPHFVFRAGL